MFWWKCTDTLFFPPLVRTRDSVGSILCWVTIHTLGTVKLNKEPKKQIATPDTQPLIIVKCHEQDETTLQELYVVDNVSTITCTAEMADSTILCFCSRCIHIGSEWHKGYNAAGINTYLYNVCVMDPGETKSHLCCTTFVGTTKCQGLIDYIQRKWGCSVWNICLVMRCGESKCF